jgi:hypothetical protein
LGALRKRTEDTKYKHNYGIGFSHDGSPSKNCKRTEPATIAVFHCREDALYIWPGISCALPQACSAWKKHSLSHIDSYED